MRLSVSQERGETEMRMGPYHGKRPFEHLLSVRSRAERSELGGKETTSKNS